MPHWHIAPSKGAFTSLPQFNTSIRASIIPSNLAPKPSKFIELPTEMFWRFFEPPYTLRSREIYSIMKSSSAVKGDSSLSPVLVICDVMVASFVRTTLSLTSLPGVSSGVRGIVTRAAFPFPFAFPLLTLRFFLAGGPFGLTLSLKSGSLFRLPGALQRSEAIAAASAGSNLSRSEPAPLSEDVLTPVSVGVLGLASELFSSVFPSPSIFPVRASSCSPMMRALSA
jgi:hypothetical protein